MSTVEKTGQLNTDAPAIPRLKLPQYGWWSEAAHGVAWAGKATVFPASIAMAATFDVEGMETVGAAIGMEGRAKFNDAFKKGINNRLLCHSAQCLGAIPPPSTLLTYSRLSPCSAPPPQVEEPTAFLA
jgi:hypothetical protein